MRNLLRLVLACAVTTPISSMAAPATGALPKLAVLPTQLDASARERVPALIDDHILTAAQSSGSYSVIGQDDIAAVVGFESQRQLLGCDEASCFSEIGGALGVDLLLTFKIARVEGVWAVTGKVVDMGEMVVHARLSKMVSGDTRALLAAMPRLVAELLGVEPPPAEEIARAEAGLHLAAGVAANGQHLDGVAGYLEVGYGLGAGVELSLFVTQPFNGGAHLRWRLPLAAVEIGPLASVAYTGEGVALAVGLGALYRLPLGGFEVGVLLDAEVAYDAEAGAVAIPITAALGVWL